MHQQRIRDVRIAVFTPRSRTARARATLARGPRLDRGTANTAPATARGRSGGWLAALGLLAIAGCFLLFANQFVRCVINNVWFDANFSGWSGPVGHEILRGRHLFRDVVLPLPPGSFVVMAAIEKAFGDGAPRLLHENWVCAVCYVLMALAGYAIALPLAGPRIALFTAAGSLGWISVWIKELAYDPLAEVWAWAAIALLVRAWTQAPGRTQRRWLLSAGLLTGLTLFFKQSTATGLFAGALTGFAYLALVERRMGGALRAQARGALMYLAGGGIGITACLLSVWLMKGSVGLFLAAMFVDGPALKGGAQNFAERTAWGTIIQPFAALPLALLALFSFLVVRIARHPRRFNVGGAEQALRPAHVAGVIALGALLFGAGALAVAARRAPSPELTRGLLLSSVMVASLSACLLVVFFFGNLDIERAEPSSRAFNAAALTTLVLGSVVSLSMTTFNPGYENNALLAIALIALFSAVERAGLAWLSWPVLALAMAMPLGWRLPRAAAAKHPVADAGFFRGMWVSDDGRTIVRAALRARELAGTAGQVLVLPEDPSLAALIDRRRPELCGAIVFPDQYPRRCVARDLAVLHRRPPDVIVLRPAEYDKWLGFLRTFNVGSPTEQLMVTFLQKHLADYERVSTDQTHWMAGSAALDVLRYRKSR